MAITAAQLLVKVGYDDSEADSGLKRTAGAVSGASIAIGSAVGNLAANTIQALPGQVFGAMTSIEDALSPMGTLLGTSSQEFAQLSEGIKGVVASSPRSAQEIGEGAYALLSAGVSGTDNVMNALNASMQLADAGLGTTAQATDIITSAMNSFSAEGLTADDAAKTFYGTIAKGKTTVADLSQGLGGIAPLASTAGVSFNDLMGAVATLTATGAKTSEVYNSMKGVISGIIKPTKGASDAAAAMGLEFNAAHLKAVGLPAFLNEVKTATGGNTETMAQLFGSTEALNSVLALTGDQADAFAANLSGVGEAGDGMAARAAEANDTLSNRFAIMKNKVMVILGDLGNKGFKFVSDMWEKHSATIMGIVTEVTGSFRALFAAFKANDGDITSNGMAGVFERIGLVAAQVVDWFRTNWPQIQEIAGQVFQAIGDVANNVLLPALGFIVEAARSVVGYIQENWPLIQETIATAFDYISTTVIPIAVQAFHSIVEIAGLVWATIQEKWPQIQEIIVQVFEVVKAAVILVVTVVRAQTEFMTKLWSDHGNTIMAVLGFVFDIVVTVVKTALGVIKGVIQTVTAVINGDWSAAWNGVKDIFGAVWEGIKGILNIAWDGIRNVFFLGYDFVLSKVGQIADGVVGFVQGLPGRISGAASGMFDGISRAFAGAINWIIDRWNGISFSLPSIDLGPLGKFGGFSVSPPPIGRLAQGGSVLDGGLTLVGEQGAELLNLPTGSRVSPLPPGGRSTVAQGGPMTVTINMPAGANGDDVVRALKAYERRNGAVPIKVA